MSNISFSQKSKSSWKTYISPEFNYDHRSSFPSFETKFKESQRCLNEYEKYNHIIIKYLVGLRFNEDPLFSAIVTRCMELGINLVYGGQSKHIFGSLGQYYASVLISKQQQRRKKQQHPLIDIEILNYKIGKPISKDKARIHFINPTINVSKIPSMQKPMIVGQSVMGI